MRNGHVDRQGSRGRGESPWRASRGPRAPGPRDHGESGRGEGEGSERAKLGARPLRSWWALDAGPRKRVASISVCVSFWNHLRRSAVEAVATASSNCGSPPPPPLPRPPPRSLILLPLPPPSRPRRAGPPPASFSSLGLLSTGCCLLGQGLRRCGCLSPLAALPLLSIRSRDWSGDPLAQTDSERATAYSLPHQGNGQAGV